MLQSRAIARLLSGDVAKAVADVVELSNIPGASPDNLYNFAVVYAIASGKFADRKLEYANRAMELLQKAVETGFREAAHMKKNTNLDSLRDRKDFKKLMADLEAKIPPQIDAAGLMCIAKGNWNEALHYWPKPTANTPINLEIEFNHAALLVLTDDKAGYQGLCAEVLKRFGTSNEARHFYLIARICSLAPDAVTDLTQPVSLAERAVADKRNGPWNTHALGLAHYRAGPFDKDRLEKAAESIRRSMDAKPRWSADICNQFVLAIVEHRQEHYGKAKELLDQACRWVDHETPKMQSISMPESKSAGRLHPHDWLAMHILRREAEDLIRVPATVKPNTELPSKGNQLELAPPPHPKKQ
jgi:hypothetical protein